MRFVSQAFLMSKDADAPHECQDAFALNADAGVAAVADGVSSTLFAGPWAQILTQSVAAGPPQVDHPEHFKAWLTEQRVTWHKSIDVSRLGWAQKMKLRQNPGAMSTLLWAELSSAEIDDETGEQVYRLRAYSIGDSCLFVIRDGQCLRSFPMTNSDFFGLDPNVLVSVDLGSDHNLELQVLDELCRVGDLLVLCTDAIGLWATKLHEDGQDVAWEQFWDMPETEWREQIISCRHESAMRVDDSTLVLLRVVEQPANEDRKPENVPDGQAADVACDDGVCDETDPQSEPDGSSELSCEVVSSPHELIAANPETPMPDDAAVPDAASAESAGDGEHSL